MTQARLSISLTIDLEKDTPDGAIRAIRDSLDLFGRQNGGTLGPWIERRRERRGVIHRPSGAAVTTGTWRILENEPTSREVASLALADIPAEMPKDPAALLSWMAQAIQYDRRFAARIEQDPDF